MITRSIPALRSERITRGASGRIGSSMIRAPAIRPSIATKMQEEPSSIDRRRTSRARGGMGAPSDT